MSEYFVKIKEAEKVQGPFSSQQIRQLAAEGKLKPDCLLSKDRQKWVKAAAVKGITFPVKNAAHIVKNSQSNATEKVGQSTFASVDEAMPGVHNLLGAQHIDEGNHEAAIKEFGQAIKQNPEYARAYFNRGSSHNIQRQYDQAIADFTRAIELDPNYMKAYVNRSVAYLEMNQLGAAREDCKTAVTLDPDCAEAHNQLGVIDYKEGRAQDALANFTRAIDLAPTLINAFLNRAIVYMNIGEYKRARTDCLKIVELDPSGPASAEARNGLRMIEERIGR